MWPRLFEQIADTHFQRRGKFFDDRDGGIASTSFDVADIGAMNASFMREGFLAPTLGFAKAAQVFGKALADDHRDVKTRLSTMYLQTMSDDTFD